MQDSQLTTVQTLLGDRVQKEKDISPYLTLRTKVTAVYFFEAETREDLLNVGKLRAQGIPVFLLGGGSNLAVLQEKIDALVVRNMYQKREVLEEDDEAVRVSVSSGYPISRLVADSIQNGWTGFEYHLGLPGTIGGAVYMNSKWTKPLTYTGDNLVEANLVAEDGEEKKVTKEYFQFAYDYSILQKSHEILLEAVFELKKDSPEAVKQRADEALAYRKETQPFGVSTSGCFFQNISEEEKTRLQLPTTSAGYLIDHAGLKNARVGSFRVSDIHANFIINEGSGDPADLEKLLSQIKQTVREKYGVELKQEVIVVN